MLIGIRSQDRKILAVVNSVDINYNSYQRIYEIWGNYKDYELGTYPTEERAMEVLDDIQTAVEKKLKVFQMPKEWEYEKNQRSY